uniref:Low density lipoprotein receptor-related protein associated protein 1 n=1 Tax=Neogobius melanostomus TaxID=47308 RepID=A0A8C6U9H9_9GOBI
MWRPPGDSPYLQETWSRRHFRDQSLTSLQAGEMGLPPVRFYCFTAVVILAKYGMDGKRDTRTMESNSLKDHETIEGDGFDDPRLDKLWNKAQSSGKFSSDELLSLKREFQHHKDKIHEYNILIDTVSRTEGERVHGLHRTMLSYSSTFDSNPDFFPVSVPSPPDCSAEFREPRVIELWEAAKRANLTQDELDSLKEELHHFETKVEKHNHYREQLDLSHQKLRHVESLGDEEHIQRNQEKYNTLRRNGAEDESAAKQVMKTRRKKATKNPTNKPQ